MQSLAAYIFLFIIGSAAGGILFRYPLPGLLNGLFYVLIFAVNGQNGESILFSICVSVLMIISITDLKTYEIPVKYNIVIGILGLVQMMTDTEHWHEYAAGFFTVSGLLLIIYLISKGKAIGGGDIKLMAAAGLLIGWKDILLAFMIGAVTAGVIHPILMKIKGKGRVLAFGPYLSFGIFITMICDNK